MQKIKVIQIIADSSLSGGPTHVLGILQNIDKTKFDSFLICPAGNLSREAKAIPGITVINIAMRSKFDLASVLEVKNEIAKIQTTGDPFAKAIIHIHGIRAGFLTRLIIPRGVKTIYTEHRFDADYRLKNPINVLIQKKFLTYLNKKTDLIIAVSSSVEKFLLAQKIASEKQLLVVPNAINLEKSEKAKNKTTTSITIGTIGNLNRQKGQQYLIKAMPLVLAKFPDAKLEIIGEGEERFHLEKLINELNLANNVFLLGTKKDIKGYLASWNLFVLPSVAETFGIAILQAMNAGLPVVATRVGGIIDIVENNKSGVLVESKTPKTLADAIVKVLNNPELARRISNEASKRLVRFDWTLVIKRLEEIYQVI